MRSIIRPRGQLGAEPLACGVRAELVGPQGGDEGSDERDAHDETLFEHGAKGTHQCR